MDCSVVIITYNAENRIRDCLNSVLDQSFDGKYELVIVDNNSSDDTVEIIQTEFVDKRENITLIELDRNHGAAGGYNRALPYTNGEMLIYLDPDTVVHVDWLSGLYDGLEQTGAAAGHSCIFEPYHDEFDVEARETYPEKRVVMELNRMGFVEDWHVPPKRIRTIELSGCSMIIRRSVVDELEYFFDEEIPFPNDDLDLGMRLNVLGDDVVFLPDSIVYHQQYQKLKSHRVVHLVQKYVGTVEGRSNAFFKMMTTKEYAKFLPKLYLGAIINVRVMRVGPLKTLGLYVAAALIGSFAVTKSLLTNIRFLGKRESILAARKRNLLNLVNENLLQKRLE